MRVWHEFIDTFDGLSEEGIREGCFPRCYEHERTPERAVVLVHGLTDSPYFLDAIGRRFHAEGWNVYLPLLHMHGLRDPMDMLGVSRAEWKRNVGFAVDAAASTGARVSVGGLSTGGTLAVYEGLREEGRIDGALFLFAAALRLTPQKPSRLVRTLHRLGLHALGRLFRSRSRFEGELIGENPYRYDRMDMDAVRQLIALIREVEALRAERESAGKAIALPVFAAHAENDQAADYRAVASFIENLDPARAELYTIDAAREVSHASLVLERDVCSASGELLEALNPEFDEMMDAALAFAKRHG